METPKKEPRFCAGCGAEIDARHCEFQWQFEYCDLYCFEAQDEDYKEQKIIYDNFIDSLSKEQKTMLHKILDNENYDHWISILENDVDER